MSSQNPFPKMTQLGPSVYYYRPPQVPRSHSAPALVILCTWMAAQPTHITKYIVGYQELFPEAAILLIRSEAPDIVYRSTAILRRRTQPAVDIVRSTYPEEATRSGILLHVFSNGGSHQAITLMSEYLRATGNIFPRHAKILDSCPGRGNFSRSYLALSAPFDRQPFYLRLPSSAAIVFILCVFWVFGTLLRRENPIGTIRQELNDKRVVRETKRVYIYSDTDPMVHWKEVEDHAEDARAKGFVVDKEKFQGSGHAAHVRVGGGERYWRIVKDLSRLSITSDQEA